MLNMKRRLRIRVAVATGAWVAYMLAFVLLYRWIGPPVVALGALPVIMTGWALGMWAGLAASVLAILLDVLLMALTARADWQVMFRGGLPGAALLLLIGAVVGRLRDMAERLRSELSHRVQLEEELRDSHEETTSSLHLLLVLSQVAQVVQSAQMTDEIYCIIGERMEKLGYHIGFLLLAHDREHLNLAYQSVDAPALRAAEKLTALSLRAFRFPLTPGGFFQRAIAEGETVWHPSFSDIVGEGMPEGMHRSVRQLASLFGMREGVVSPMMVGGETRGLLLVTGSELRPIMPGFAILASQTAIALENAGLLEAEREQRRIAEALAEAAGALSSTLDLDRVLDCILEQVERVVRAETYNIMLVEDDMARLVGWRGYEQAGLPEPTSLLTVAVARYPLLLKMMQTGQPVAVPDTALHPDWVVLEGREWWRSYVGAPIRVAGQTVGFLNVEDSRPGRLGPTDAWRLQAFADHAGTAIENARLYRELRRHADELEQRVQERTTELQVQYARLEVILQSTADGIAVTDGEGKLLQTNPVAQAWLTQTFSAEDAGRVREAVGDLGRRAASGAVAGEHLESVLELSAMDLQLAAAPIVGPPSEAAAVVAIHDVSYLKELDRLKSQFVSNVSHELRTPITTIKLYADLMQTSPPEEWPEYVDALARQADWQVQLVEDILQLSRVDAGRLERRPEATSLGELAAMAVLNHQGLAQEHGLTLEHQRAEPDVVALVDPERLLQALNNLLQNAVRYTREGGSVAVSTATGRGQDGQAWATVTVADSGIGIAEEELPHIFERFYRGEEVQRMQAPGTGLGLAIVKEIVELHGGRVTVESQVGRGSAFTVWLPLADG